MPGCVKVSGLVVTRGILNLVDLVEEHERGRLDLDLVVKLAVAYSATLEPVAGPLAVCEKVVAAKSLVFL